MDYFTAPRQFAGRDPTAFWSHIEEILSPSRQWKNHVRRTDCSGTCASPRPLLGLTVKLKKDQ